MTRRVLVPIDGSEHADAALEYACTMFADAEITVLFVLNPFGYYEEHASFPDRLDDWYANLEERADRLFEEARDRASDHGIEISTATARGRPDRAIVKYATENDFDAIVLGAHGRSDFPAVLLGSVAERVVRRSSVPVTVVR